MGTDILELQPVPDWKRLHIRTPTNGAGCWGVRIRYRPLKTNHEHVDSILKYAVVWGMQHWALEITHTHTGESFLFELMKKSMVNSSGVYGPGEGSCYWARYGFMHHKHHEHLDLGVLPKEWGPEKVRQAAHDILTEDMPNYYLGAADCQWFCLRLLYKIMNTHESVDKILKAAKMEGTKMFREKHAPLTRAQSAPQDIARGVIRTITVVKKTAKVATVHANGDIPMGMRQLVLELIAGTEDFKSAAYMRAEDDVDNPHHPHRFNYHAYDWRNGAKAAADVIARGIHECEKRYHIAEKVKDKASEILHLRLMHHKTANEDGYEVHGKPKYSHHDPRNPQKHPTL